MEKLTGRHEERKLLEEARHSSDAELIAVYGRRRVGKTFLIRSVYAEEILFDFTGVHEAGLKEQLMNFRNALQAAMGNDIPLAIPENWIEAFAFLQKYLEPKLKKGKGVIFIDEFPWIHTPKSGFLQAFGHFWNNWATKQDNIIVVICGSAASWMIRNVVNNKGGLHNRITKKIRLLPFNLNETEAYLKSRKVILDRYQLLQLYMAMGGIPHYLKEVKRGESAAQVTDRLYFSKDGFLKKEFQNLYKSLFDDAQHHMSVIKALAKKGSGLTRNELIDHTKLSSGGTTTLLLEELEESGFISAYIPFGKTTKESIYKLSDEYSLFYLKFIEGSRAGGLGTWLRQINTASYTSWSGFSFESVCQKHITQIKKALGIAGVMVEESGWRYQPGQGSKEKGAQIDLLLDRQDRCINICEMKFSNSEFVITKAYQQELQNKIEVFQQQTKTKKTLFLTMITAYGVKQNIHSTASVQNEISMNDLFVVAS